MTSFKSDIRPLFRDSDIECMKDVVGLDLANVEHVRKRSADILGQLESGSMPTDEAWPDADVDLFRCWIAEGMCG